VREKINRRKKIKSESNSMDLSGNTENMASSTGKPSKEEAKAAIASFFSRTAEENSEEERAKRRVVVDVDIEVPPARASASGGSGGGGAGGAGDESSSSPQAALRYTRLDSEDEYASIRANFKSLDAATNPIFAGMALSLALEADGTVDLFKAGDVIGALKVSLSSLLAQVDRSSDITIKEHIITKPDRSGVFHIWLALMPKRTAPVFEDTDAGKEEAMDYIMALLMPVQSMLLSIQLLVASSSIFANNATLSDLGLDLHAR